MTGEVTESHWEFSKYFMKCNKCGYELPNGSRIFAPRKCPKCDSVMREPPKRGPLYKFLERSKKV